MKEMGYLNHQNDLYLHGMKEDLKQYTMPSPWFENRYKEMQRTCYEMATNLPAQIEEQSVVTGETFGSVKMAEVRASSSASVRLRRNCAWSTTSRRRSSPTLGPWRRSWSRASRRSTSSSPWSNNFCTERRWSICLKSSRRTHRI